MYKPDFFPELREPRHSASFGEARVTARSTGRTFSREERGARRSQPHMRPIWIPFCCRLAVANPRARKLAPDRRRGILLCSDFSEHTRSPGDAGEGPSLLALAPGETVASSPAATPSLTARGGSFPSPSADVRPCKGKKGVAPRASLGVTRIRQAHPGKRLVSP